MERKTTFAEFKKMIKERGVSLLRFRQRLTKCFGAYYWETLTDAEFDAVFDSLIVDLSKSPMRSEAEVNKFLAKEMMTRDPFDIPQWRIFFQESYGQDSSLFILKVHHTVCDGHGLISYVNSITDQPQDLWANIRNPPAWKKLMLYLTVPYYFLKMSLLVITSAFPNNPLHRGQPNSGNKVILTSRDFPLGQLKEKCRGLKCTVNDALMSAISVTLKEYFISKGDERTQEVFVGFPVNVRSKPAIPGTFDCCNLVGAFF